MTAPGRTVVIPHLGRVEGHGGIYVNIAGEAVTDVDMGIHEGSRYYEALLTGKRYEEVQGIITRVCAICSASHSVAALTAIERALGVEVSPRVWDLRGLLLLGSTIESHALHVFALALPDFLGKDSVLGLAPEHPEVVRFALGLKNLGNSIQELIGGRAVHPVNTVVGGFGRLPRHRELADLRDRLGEALAPLGQATDLAASIDIPEWAAQPTIFVALEPYDEGFRFRGDTLCTSRGEQYDLASYSDVVREHTVEHSHAKHAALASGETYAVGSLARLALWSDRLGGQAAAAARRLVPEGAADNMLRNTWAQLVELVHAVEHGTEIIDRLLDGPEDAAEIADFEVRAGRGIGAIEAPRGTLFHEYELDAEGRVVDANVITPTAQNLANIERDMRSSVERLLADGRPDDAVLKRSLEMVARAYDPCISCSVHIVRDDAPADRRSR